MRRNDKVNGFTIVEIIIVVGVIAILLGIGIGTFANTQNRAKKEEFITVAEKVKVHLNTYYSEKNRYPSTMATVVSYLNSRGETELVTDFNNSSAFTYAALDAAGTSCADTGADACERYTITINKTAWGGGTADTNKVIEP